MPKIANKECLEDMCRWHMIGSHTTNQCQVFKGLLTRQRSLKRLVVSEMERHAMELEAYRADLAKSKVLVNSKSTPNLVMHEEIAKTYKEVAQKFPLQTRVIEG